MVNGKSFPKVNTQQKRPRALLEGVFVRVNFHNLPFSIYHLAFTTYNLRAAY